MFNRSANRGPGRFAVVRASKVYAHAYIGFAALANVADVPFPDLKVELCSPRLVLVNPMPFGCYAGLTRPKGAEADEGLLPGSEKGTAEPGEFTWYDGGVNSSGSCGDWAFAIQSHHERPERTAAMALRELRGLELQSPGSVRVLQNCEAVRPGRCPMASPERQHFP
jgi:hypothetical protein